MGVLTVEPEGARHAAAASAAGPLGHTAEAAGAAEAAEAGVRPAGWGRSFDPDRLAMLELRMWKAYYRRQRLRLFGLLVLANREQAGAGWPRAIAGAFYLARGAAGFGRATGDYERFEADVVRGYRMLGMPPDVDAETVARRELRWWVVRREIGLGAGEAAGQAIAALYAALYRVPEATVAEAGRLRGLAAEVRDRGATADPDGPAGAGRGYWPEVARLLRQSYRSLYDAVGVPREARTAANDYHFVTTWEIGATPEAIVEVLSDAAALARWWPSVYLDVSVLTPGDERGLGKVVELWTKGWLPYTLRWRFRVTDVQPRGFTIQASGDFVGRGIWTLRPERDPADPAGPLTSVVYDWRIVAEKGLLKRLSFLMKPIFGANHRWAMARGEESLRLELARRRGEPAAEPPGPTFPHNLRRRLRRTRPNA